MNWEPVKNVLMLLLGAIGSWVVQRGWIDADTMTAAIGAVITLLGIVWTAWRGTTPSMVATTAALTKVDTIQVNDVKVAAQSPTNVTVTR